MFTCLVLHFLAVLTTMSEPASSLESPFVVQSLSSRYALLLGGFGPGYRELREVEVVKHDGVCHGAVSSIPADPGRFLGDVSGMAESVGDGVVFCRHTKCWRLDMKKNKWRRVGGLTTARDGAASVEVGGTMVVLGGRAGPASNSTGEEEDTVMAVESFDVDKDEWVDRPEWAMETPRYSFCAVPLNETALLVAGGYTGRRRTRNEIDRWAGDAKDNSGATASVRVLDTASGRWESIADLPSPRYGHACLLMEWQGRPGVLATGGALTPREAVFYDVGHRHWKRMEASLPYSVDGHKAVLVEGIPVVFSWRRALAFDGAEWRHAPELAPTRSRSAFAVAAVPGHLVRGCHVAQTSDD